MGRPIDFQKWKPTPIEFDTEYFKPISFEYFHRPLQLFYVVVMGVESQQQWHSAGYPLKSLLISLLAGFAVGALSFRLKRTSKTWAAANFWLFFGALALAATFYGFGQTSLVYVCVGATLTVWTLNVAEGIWFLMPWVTKNLRSREAARQA